MRRFPLTPFSVVVTGCLLLAGWALWTGGIFDGPVARQVRGSSVYAAPGTGLDTAAAQRVIGNRRLVVVFLPPDADLGRGCDAVRRAAEGTLVVLLKRDGDGLRTYGCMLLPGTEFGGPHFSDSFVADQMIGDGVQGFADRPLDAVKVLVVNFDTLAHLGVVPPDARTVRPSLPRYLVAAAAVLAVLVGSVLLYALARRAGRTAAALRSRRDEATDSRTVLSATTAGVAQQIIDLDARYRTTATRHRPGRDPTDMYQRLASQYVDLLDDIAAADRRGEQDFTGLTARAEGLAGRLRSLAGSATLVHDH
jgi:hypothetical protein